MPKPNAFMAFATEWKLKNAPNIPVAEAVKRASPFWEKMSKEEREKYANKSNYINLDSNKGNKPKQGLQTCVRTSIDMELQAEKEKKQKEQLEIETIQKIIENARDLRDQKFYFIFVNFFIPENAVPAEIAIVEFSLKDGVCRQKHWFINPHASFYGMLHTALAHVTATHQLPLPPNALGDKEPHEIYFEILEFLNIERLGVASSTDYPLLFTYNTCIQAVEKALTSLMSNKKLTVKKLRIYPIHQLFYLLKCATSVYKGDKIKNIHITNIIFDRDPFEFEETIACQYHQDNDRTRYCALSKVIRWAYTFADYMLSDLDIEFIPGKHCPQNTNTADAQAVICEKFEAASLNEKAAADDSKPIMVKKPNINLDFLQTTIQSKHDYSGFTVPECNSPYNQWKRNDPSLPPDSRHFDIDPVDNGMRETSNAPKLRPHRGRGIALLSEKAIPKFGGVGRGRGVLFGRGISILNDTAMSDLSSIGQIPRL